MAGEVQALGDVAAPQADAVHAVAASAPAVSERRLAAVVAADIAGYSRLMALDEADTLARLRGHRRDVVDPAIAENRGLLRPVSSLSQRE